jgi:hypothetical protein
MKKITIGVVSRGTGALAFVAAVLAFPSICSAAAAACAAAAQGNTLNSYNTGVTPTGDSNGCWLTDQSFSNFSTTATSGQTNSTTDIHGTGGASLPSTVDAIFDPTTAGAWSETGSGGTTFASGVGYLTNSQETFLTITSGYTGTPANVKIDSASLTATGSTGDSGGTADSMRVTETFCIGNAACGTAADNVVLVAIWGNGAVAPTSYTCTVGASVTSDFSCGANGSTPITVTFTIPQATLTVTDAYTMAVHSTTTDTLTSFTNAFQDGSITPEPSTFVLLGTALGGLGLLRARRKKA